MRKRKRRVFLHTTAVHEAGHALPRASITYRPFTFSWNLTQSPSYAPYQACLIPWLGGHLKCKYGGIGRMRMYQAQPDGSFVVRTAINSPTFRKRAEDHIVMLLAGREATELLFGLGHSGIGHKKDYSYARKIIRCWLQPGADIRTCKSIIDSLRPRAKRLLRKWMAWVIRVARELDLHGKLSAKEVREFVGGNDFDRHRARPAHASLWPVGDCGARPRARQHRGRRDLPPSRCRASDGLCACRWSGRKGDGMRP
jgi:hypothetical protein